tara:strand:- start:493 stop:1014 length:522 start_codon:yes stop_codon:yes gene_type:complete
MQDSTPTRRLAFHRTSKAAASMIIREGILTMKTQGFGLADGRKDPQQYEQDRAALIARGFSFGIPSLNDITNGPRGFPQLKESSLNQMWHAMSIVESTFIRVGSVSLHWDEDGETIAVDMDALEATGVTIMGDSYGDCESKEVRGDIPSSCVVGIVSDEWMRANGYTVEAHAY